MNSEPQAALRRGGLTISAKLLIWCFALILVFLAATRYLQDVIRDVVGTSEAMVSVNYETAKDSERIIEMLFTLMESRKRYAVLQSEEDLEICRVTRDRYRRSLEAMVAKGAPPQQKWRLLAERLRASRENEDGFPSDAQMNEWIGELSKISRLNRQTIWQRMADLGARGRRAERIGFWAVLGAMLVGVAGSLFLAWRFNRSLRELRRGIQALSRDGEMPRVSAVSGDEFGQLAQAFNSMVDRLEHEERMRSDFIGMLSHEIRTPLTSIRESVSLVGEGSFGPVNERQKRFLDLSVREAERLAGLLSRLMQVSQLEHGRPDPEIADVDAGTLVAEAASRTHSVAMARQIEIETEIPEEPLLVRADAGQVGQVLFNLLGNAVKFSPSGSLVGISVQPSPEGGEAIFSVVDEGPGVPEEERPYVFGRYYRGEHFRERMDGAGLGLSISRAIVEAHGGRIWLDDPDDPDCGCVFRFALPLAENESCEDTHDR